MVRERPGPGCKILYLLRDEMGSELGGWLEASIGSLRSTPGDDELV